MNELRVTVAFPFMAPGTPHSISPDTLWTALADVGIRGHVQSDRLTPAQVLHLWPTSGWDVLKAAIQIDFPTTGYLEFCATEASERASHASMAHICQKLLKMAVELYSHQVERVATCECTVWNEFGQDPEVDLDFVRVDGVVLSEESVLKHIDIRKVKAEALSRALALANTKGDLNETHRG